MHLGPFFLILENKRIDYTDDSTFISVVQSPGFGVTVAESPNRDLGKVSELDDICWVKLNASKTKTMIVCRSRTIHHLSPNLTIGDPVLKECDDLAILGVAFVSKMTFEKHLRSVSWASSQMLGIYNDR